MNRRILSRRQLLKSDRQFSRSGMRVIHVSGRCRPTRASQLMVTLIFYADTLFSTTCQTIVIKPITPKTTILAVTAFIAPN